MFRYEIWFEGNCLREDEGFETYEDAEDAANEEVLNIIEEWKEDGSFDDEEPDDFEIKIA